MATVNIYDSGTDRSFTVTFDLKSSVLSSTVTGEVDYYIDVSTSLKKPNGASFGHYKIQTMSDYPPGGTIGTSFDNLCSQYVKYFMDEAELVASSSSSSQSSSSSTSNSSSSSSERYTTSSNSSSSTSISSESSPSSESIGNSSSSSSS